MSDITWKNVFNTRLRPILWGHISVAIEVAKAGGYPYLLWNGRVYTVEGVATNIFESSLS